MTEPQAGLTHAASPASLLTVRFLELAKPFCAQGLPPCSSPSETSSPSPWASYGRAALAVLQATADSALWKLSLMPHLVGPHSPPHCDVSPWVPCLCADRLRLPARQTARCRHALSRPSTGSVLPCPGRWEYSGKAKPDKPPQSLSHHAF